MLVESFSECTQSVIMPSIWIFGLLSLVSPAGVLVLAQESIGCFKSSALDPDLPQLLTQRVNLLNECIKECKARYFMFSGLMNGYQCYCGSRYGKNGPSKDCNIKCMDDPTLFCGSDKSINIYSTGQKGPSPPQRLTITKYKQDSLEIAWQPPDVPNGKVISYTLKAKVLETAASYPLPPIEVEVVGEYSNTTTLYSLHPGTKYNITIFASNNQGLSDETYATDWTRIGPPNKPSTPKILQKSQSTITIEILAGSSENGPLTCYHVVVVQAGTIAPTSNNIAYDSYDKASREGLGYYIAAKFDVSDYPQYKLFEIGNGKVIGGYYNAPLDKKIGQPQIGIALESRVRGEVQYSYSDLTSSIQKIQIHENKESSISVANIILWILIVLLGVLLLTLILIFLILRKKFQQVQMQRLPEQQELTFQGPMYEVDNMAYIPEDVPERTNHYQELKSKVWSIPRNFLTFDLNPVRRGRFGSVHMGSVQRDAISVDVIVHKISDTQLKGSEKRQMLRELDVCIKAGTSKYIASLVGNCETPDTLFVTLELPLQSLKTRLLAARSGERFPCDQILRMGACVADGLRHLESLKIIHSCVCARSVGLSLDWSPKLMGHGLSKYGLEDVKYARWTAIECFSNQIKHQPGVVWAFGVLIWEMFSMGGTPYSDMEMDSDVETAINDGYRLYQLSDMTDPVYEVMSSCWLLNPEERPTFDELVRLDTLTMCPITSITELYRPELELN